MRFSILIVFTAASWAAQCPSSTRSPRGWNSWDPVAGAVNETNILQAAEWIRDNLLQYGFDTITIDGGWYDNRSAGSRGSIVNEYGLPVPDVTRFPSSAGGAGLLPLARQVNAMGLKLGAWTIRGITTEAYAADLPIQNSNFTARDVGLVSAATNCSWDPSTLGTNAPSAAADAWYASLAKHYIANGLDFVKIDCMFDSSTRWWYEDEVATFATQFSNFAPGITISWSPGDDMNPAAASVISAKAPAWGRMYRITPDFHDLNGVKGLMQHLETAAFMAPFIGVNDSFPDLDMLPFGLQAGAPDGHPRANNYTADEQRLIMTLWAVTRAPLILGAFLPLAADDNLTLSLVSNAAVLDINARSCQNAPTVVYPTTGTNSTGLYGWTALDGDGGIVVALFNVRDVAANMSASSGLPLGCVSDVWTGESQETLDKSGLLTRVIAPHASGLFRVAKCA